MPFLALPQEAKAPLAEVLPDGRKRLTRYFQITTLGIIPPELDYAVKTADPWPSAQTPSGWTGLLLTYKRFSDEIAPRGQDTRPIVQLIFEQISSTGETQTGGVPLTQLPDGRDQAVYTYVMFSSSTYTPQTPGSSSVTIGAKTYYLWSEENTNDGTLRNITRTYQTAGTVYQEDESLNGGKLLKRVIKTFHDAPATPSGFTLVDQGNENPNGYDIFTYTFYSADSGAGAGGEISRRYVNSDGGPTNFDPTDPDAATGEVRCVITYLTPISTTSNPITGPTNFFLVGLDVEDKDGFRVWTGTYGFGGGDEIIIDVRGAPDGALIYTVTQNAATASTPAYPGSGSAYLVNLTNTRGDGFYKNTAVYHKPPATVTFKKKINFTKPGIAAIGGSPIQFTLDPQVTMTLLADVEVSYATSQITDTPFTVTSWATFYESYTPEATGIPISNTQGLGGYLGQASGTSGSGYYNGVSCTAYSYSLGSSTPSTFGSGAKVLDVDNDPYLFATDGTQIFRRTKVSYTF